MVSAVTRKVGNSVSVSIPSELNVKVGTEYIFHKSKNGAITMVPKVTNPYTSREKFTSVNDNTDFEIAGMKEMIDGNE